MTRFHQIGSPEAMRLEPELDDLEGEREELALDAYEREIERTMAECQCTRIEAEEIVRRMEATWLD